MHAMPQLSLCSLANETDFILSGVQMLIFFFCKNNNIVEYCVTDLLLTLKESVKGLQCDILLHEVQ